MSEKDHFHNFFLSNPSDRDWQWRWKGIGKITYFLASSVRSVFVAINRHEEEDKYGLFGMSEHEQVYELNGKDWNSLSYWTTADSNDETRYSGSSDIAPR